MDSLDRWQTQNEEYLQAALAWLRLKLARLAEPVAAGMPVQPVPRAMPVTVAAPGSLASVNSATKQAWANRRRSLHDRCQRSMIWPPPGDGWTARSMSSHHRHS